VERDRERQRARTAHTERHRPCKVSYRNPLRHGGRDARPRDVETDVMWGILAVQIHIGLGPKRRSCRCRAHENAGRVTG
jgi:hypothetical protein